MTGGPMGLGARFRFRESGSAALRHARAFSDEEEVRSRSPHFPASRPIGGIGRRRLRAIPCGLAIYLAQARGPDGLAERSVSSREPWEEATVLGFLSVHQGPVSLDDFGRIPRGSRY